MLFEPLPEWLVEPGVNEYLAEVSADALHRTQDDGFKVSAAWLTAAISLAYEVNRLTRKLNEVKV